MYSSAYVWAKVLGQVEKQMGAAVVSTWFDDAEVVELTAGKLVLHSPSPFRRKMILQRCADCILSAIDELFSMRVELVVLGDEELDEYRGQSRKPKFVQYNPQFTFEKFVVGPSNRFAHAAAVAVANKPAEAYNPLFIYGASGLGKTHLLYAIAAEIHRQHPDSNIIYIKGDQFTNELIEALQNGQNVAFRSKYRGADLLLMDDIQFIAGKASTEEEFFHTFNTLYENKKQLVMTSDRPPEEMLKLEDRLRTRFTWGLVADIIPPDYETRMAIIKNKAISLGLEMPNDVCDYIAQNITSNVRQIEGVVNKVVAYRDLNGMTIDIPSVARAIRDMYKGKAEALPTPGLIIAEVSRYYSIPESTVRGTLKNKGTAEARRLAMYLCRQLTNLSLPDIGQEFGKDHSTVLYAIRKVEASLKDGDQRISDNIREITANINSRL